MDPVRNRDSDFRSDYTPIQKVAIGAAGVLAVGTVALGLFCAMRYKIAGPSQLLVKTGWRVPDVYISKTTLLLPLQKVRVFSITPSTFSIGVHAMSNERIPCNIPSVWTIGLKR